MSNKWNEVIRTDHPAAWYASQVAKWHPQDVYELEFDLNLMHNWLSANDYVKDDLPTDKFLQQEFLIIADTAAERRKVR